MDCLVDLEVGKVMVLILLELVGLEIHHQHHHHKEIMVGMEHLYQEQIIMVQVVAVVQEELDLMEHLPLVEMEVQDHLHLFPELH